MIGLTGMRGTNANESVLGINSVYKTSKLDNSNYMNKPNNRTMENGISSLIASKGSKCKCV